MNSTSPTEQDLLPLEVEEQIDGVCLRFEEAWQSRLRPGLRPYLSEIAEEWRVVLLGELLRLDVEYCLKSGETPLRGEYLAAYPELASALGAALAVLPHAESVVASATAQAPPTPSPAADATSQAGHKECGDNPSCPTFIGGYRVERLLQVGGMGAVYLARDERLGRAVALKTMRAEMADRPGAAERFLREARSVARVDHDNVIPIWQVGEDAGIPFIAMPLLQGESLADRLRREPVSPPEVIAKVGREVAEGLAAAHARGLVHRDVKPGNIWLEGDLNAPDSAARFRRCKVLDFGLARPVQDNAHLTSVGELLGTPAYMSPEQARGEPVDHRTDLFSLGAVLYRMAVGEEPFPGATAMSVLAALLVKDPLPPASKNPAVPPELSRFIMRMLAKRKEDRPESAQAVAAVFSRMTGPPSAASTTRPLTARPRAHRRRRTWVAGLIGLAAAVAVADGIWKLQPERPTLKEADAVPVVAPGDEKGSPIPAPINRERRATEWALGCGGKVVVKAGEAETNAALIRELPPDPFLLVGVDLNGCQDRVTDDGLDNLCGLTGLTTLYLTYAPVTDAGVERLKGLTRLTSLSLLGTRITDDGLKHLEGMTELNWLSLQGSRGVTDAGVEHLKGLTRLKRLYLFETGVTDAGLKHLKGMSQLESLGLGQTQVTGAGLEHLQDLRHLFELNLTGAPVSDDGLSHLDGLIGLTHLSLMMTPVTDAGLEHLKGRAGLKYLDVSRTKVTDAGIKQVAALKGLAWLMANDIELTDDGLESLSKLSQLRTLYIQNTKVSPKGIAKLRRALPDCAISPQLPAP